MIPTRALPLAGAAVASLQSGGLGRTEDLVAAPDGRSLLVAGYARNRLWHLPLEMEGETLRIAEPQPLCSAQLAGPHGVAVVATTAAGVHLVVANRFGSLSFHLLTPEGQLADVEPRPPVAPLEFAPSVVCTRPRRDGRVDVFSCSNDVPVLRCTTVVADGEQLFVVEDRTTSLALMDTPDGLAAHAVGDWLAVSNHHFHRIFLYDLTTPWFDQRPPDGVIAGVEYPHGLCFAPDGLTLYAADAGAPFVHVIEAPGGWRGMFHPVRRLRVMDDVTFHRARVGPEEGGPKGVALVDGGRTLFVTSDAQPLAGFDASLGEPEQTWELDAGCRELAGRAELVARVRDLEWRLADAGRQAEGRVEGLAYLAAKLDEAHAETAAARRQAELAHAEMSALQATRLFRFTRRPRAVYSWLLAAARRWGPR